MFCDMTAVKYQCSEWGIVAQSCTSNLYLGVRPFFCFPKATIFIGDKKSSPSPFHHCISLSSPPLFAMLTSFQFTESALPTPLAAEFPCDSCWPIAEQAHLVPCEAGASLHYITAATGCHGNTHGHYHTVSVCVEHHFVYLSVCWMCIDTGFPLAWKIIESLLIWWEK